MSQITWVLVSAFVLVLLAMFAQPTRVWAVDFHVPNDTDTDACAICHRAHTAASDTTWTAPALGEESRSALIVGKLNDEGDTGLCYACHGVEALGSEVDVQTSFSSASIHPIAPESGAYGPAPMNCSSCHDTHGSERTVDDQPYAALLRARSISTPEDLFFQGDAYCAACHEDRPADVWDGLTVWQQTAHSREITPTASGTDVVCSVCHAAHGSDNPPLIVETIYPPAVETTLSVPANDRWLCFTCHAAAQATYPAGATYQTSTHAVSETTVTPVGEWATAQDGRKVGECQNCHNPMGASDGAGGVIPKLAVAKGSAVCERCHFADSAIATDLAQFDFPASESAKPELIVGWEGARQGSVFDRLSVWTQETTGTTPLPLVGPRVFDTPGSSVDVAAGDIDGNGIDNLIVADGSSHTLDVYEINALSDLDMVEYSIDATPTYVAVGDFFLDAGNFEVAVVSRSEYPPYSSELYVYRYSSVGPSLTKVTGPLTLGDDASGIAVGDVRGTLRDDVAVTCIGDDTLRIFTESTTVSDTFDASSYATRSEPRGPSIGDAVDAAGTEIVVANSGETVDTVSVFSGAGSVIASYDATVTGYPGAVAYDTLVADVLPNGSGETETYVALRSADGISGINMFPQTTGGLDQTNMQSLTTGAYVNTSSLASGDVDSDGENELVVGNAGIWADGANPTAPSTQVYSSASSTALSGTAIQLISEGAEIAGGVPAVVVTDLGALGESRHPSGQVEGAHNSTETVPFTARHVECVDCHNVHETTSTVPPAGAPLVTGALKGSWGVGVLNNSVNSITYLGPQRVTNEYETCFKCHSGYSVTPFSSGDIASLVNTRNPSFHAIETSTTNSMATLGSFVTATPAWTNSSVMYCTDCHGNSDSTEPAGPHSSESAPVLSSPYYGVANDDSGYLCYQCHDIGVYQTGLVDNHSTLTYSNFYDAVLDASPSSEGRLHKLHVNDKGFSCGTCHQSHGSSQNYHTIRDELDWVHSDTGGACYTPCHSGSTAEAYSRTSVSAAPSSYTLNQGTLISGDLASLASSDANDLIIQDAAPPTSPAISVEFTFTGIGYTPTAFELDGGYAGDAADEVYVDAYNQTTNGWIRIAGLPSSATASEETYPLADPDFVSGGGQVRVRIVHVSPGDITHALYLDRVWLRQ